MTPTLHPQAESLRRDLTADRTPPVDALSPTAVRAMIRDRFIRSETPELAGGVREMEIAGPESHLPIRVYEPGGGGSYPVVVYFHGGGWVRGDLDTHDELCRDLTRRVGCLTLSVDYRRAPEHSFPAAAVDAHGAFEWAVEHVESLGGDPDRIAVAGDSAGGNLATVTALMARDRDGPAPIQQVLFYPVTNHAFDTNSYREHAEDPVLSRAAMRWYWNQYLDRALDGQHPYASPLAARDLSGVSPATVITAGVDPLRDDGHIYADRLADAGVPISYSEYDDVFHGFVSFPELHRAEEARTEAAAALQNAFDAI
ncbi:alpha/beta hydrolase [Haladaptatus halobius]|uniref:alpha/beta hydrolase n=1 Tax=Haladaptatus halobius TaxID=2884875 RepID=UPI001D0BAAED|nr:alpha/beta hydrolase [Haladaptatus halobius]